MDSWNGETWNWSFDFNCDVENGAAATQFFDLVILLAPVQPCQLIGDSFVWWRNTSGFTVSNTYDSILSFDSLSPPLNNSVSLAFSRLWKSKVPSRIHIFGWRLIWNILASKVELAKRGTLLDPSLLVCSLSGRAQEDLDHLFLYCDIARDWWHKLFLWLHLDDIIPTGIILERFFGLEDYRSFWLGWICFRLHPLRD
ncbi:uncharacterized protein LOC131605866 [Vicia villosa]|uniref:uncharacterized protein LOC131605866 n=1 Tax=Vicia villosa TaxID=3911 RepID=UPI00273B9B41|nr:uncharacterized protein LOC131605866 [Vicia villosa]